MREKLGITSSDRIENLWMKATRVSKFLRVVTEKNASQHS